MRARGIWLEITTLLIPGLNDDGEEIKRLISFLLELDADMPWHVSRFYPQYRLQHIPPTAPDSIQEILHLGAGMGLNYLYSGNVAADRWSDTHCPRCKEKLIGRQGYHSEIVGLQSGKCRFCGQAIPGIWES